MTLGDTQRTFTICIARLIVWVYEQPGWELTLGDAYRSPEEAERLAVEGKGIKDSLHTSRLAIDLNLFVNGEYQVLSSAYLPLGEHWKTLHPLARWGGDFHTRPDGNHFSFTWAGKQ